MVTGHKKVKCFFLLLFLCIELSRNYKNTHHESSTNQSNVNDSRLQHQTKNKLTCFTLDTAQCVNDSMTSQVKSQKGHNYHQWWKDTHTDDMMKGHSYDTHIIDCVQATEFWKYSAVFRVLSGSRESARVRPRSGHRSGQSVSESVSLSLSHLSRHYYIHVDFQDVWLDMIVILVLSTFYYLLRLQLLM